MLHRPPSFFDTENELEKIQQLNAPAILMSAQTQRPHWVRACSVGRFVPCPAGAECL